MHAQDRTYHLLRAEAEIDRARDSANMMIAEVHLELARLHRDRALCDGPFIITQSRLAQNR